MVLSPRKEKDGATLPAPAAKRRCDAAGATTLEQLRGAAGALIASAGASPDKAAYADLLRSWGRLGGPADDVIVQIGEKVFGVGLPAAAPAAGGEAPPKVRVPFPWLEGFMRDCFLAAGLPEREAAESADVLIESDKRGIDSHGIGRLKPIYFDRIAQGILTPYVKPEILRESASSAFVDGKLGLGLYIGPYCMRLAIEKAKKSGVGFVVAQNSTHYGIAGYYATMATQAGCVGLTGTNARPSIAPTFGTQGMLGTNPVTFGIPTADEFPFVIDCATSVNQRGKIEKYARMNEPTPPGQVVDKEGRQRTDTHQILKDLVTGQCALAPMGGAGTEMGGYKGYGWATAVELLCTAFQKGPFGADICGIDRETGKPKPMPLGHYFLAIDVDLVCGDLLGFQKHASELLSALRGSRKDPTGPGRIWTAGEVEWDARKERGAGAAAHSFAEAGAGAGGCPVPLPLQKDLQALRESLPGMKEKYAKLPFE